MVTEERWDINLKSYILIEYCCEIGDKSWLVRDVETKLYGVFNCGAIVIPCMCTEVDYTTGMALKFLNKVNSAVMSGYRFYFDENFNVIEVQFEDGTEPKSELDYYLLEYGFFDQEAAVKKYEEVIKEYNAAIRWENWKRNRRDELKELEEKREMREAKRKGVPYLKFITSDPNEMPFKTPPEPEQLSIFDIENENPGDEGNK